MLELLRIRNLALIEDMELEFSSGMNVLTGETGAGKSFILKALNFLLGEKLEAGLVRPSAERAEISGIFIKDSEELIIRRELVAASGRSRLYINDTLSSQESLQSLRPSLIVYTSQHEQQKLLSPAWQAQLIDTLIEDQTLLKQRDTLLRELLEIRSQRTALESKWRTLSEKRELLEMQQKNIDAVNPQVHEEEILEEKRRLIRNAQGLKERHEKALALLHGEEGIGLLAQIRDFAIQIATLSNDDERFSSYEEDLERTKEVLTALDQLLRRLPAESEEEDLDSIEERLFELARLKRTLHRSLPDILSLKNEINESISFLDACSLDISRLSSQEKEIATTLRETLIRLAPLRRDAACVFAKNLEKELALLGFSSEVHVAVECVPYSLADDIQDERARILWAPNPGQAPHPLEKIASGGELSRFLLALVSVRPGAESATYLFDEVDSGVGGITLNHVADKLAQLATQRQMLLITHWPQLAIRADRHFQVSKIVNNNNTYTLCLPLDSKARETELIRMGGGGAQGKALAKSLQKKR